MLGIASGEKTNSYGFLHMDTPVLSNQHGLTYCANTGCSLENITGVIDDIYREKDRDREKERERETERESGKSILSPPRW